MKPATQKIWCPRCHKRHKVPLDADGKTLRCRGCRFAFAIQDGLKTEPDVEDVAHVATAVAPEQTAKKTSTPASREPAKPQLDHDYDDILDVLDSPTQEPVRAYAKSANQPSASVDPVEPQATPATISTKTTAEKNRATASENNEQRREPITRGQVIAHRRTRTICMLIAVAFAVSIGATAWLGADKLFGTSIYQWERKLLYSFGVPARFLPPIDAEDIEILPFNQVKLLGDHAELADRDDSFRDEFVSNPRGEDNAKFRDPEMPEASADNSEKFAGVNRPNNAARNQRNNVARNRANNGGMRAIEAANAISPAIVAPGAANPRNQAVRVEPNPAAFNRNVRGGNPNNGRARVWAPPTISDIDRQRLAGRGIDPTQAGVLKLQGRIAHRFAIKDDLVFSVDQKRNFVATEWRSKKELAKRRLDANVLSILTVADDADVQLAGPWLLLDNGRLERWKLNGNSLERQVSISLGQLKEQNSVSIAISKTQLAFNTERKIIIADYLATAGEIVGQTKIALPEYVNGNSQSIQEPVHALQFSSDGRELLAVIHDQIIRFDSDTGKQLSKTALSSAEFGPLLPRNSPPGSCQISSDLSTIFVCHDGTIRLINSNNGQEFGANWPSFPLPIRFLASSQNFVVGITDSNDPVASIFNFDSESMVVDQPRSAKDSNSTPPNNPDAKPSKLEIANANGFAPFQVFESTPLEAPIKSIEFLNDGRLATLTSDSQIFLIDWQKNPTSIQLDLADSDPIEAFAFSKDSKSVVTVTSKGCRVWNVSNLESGATELVTEFSGHVHPVSRVVFCEDGTHVISGDNRGNLFAWSATTGELTGSVNAFKSSVIDVVPKGDRGFYAMDQRMIAKGDVGSSRDRVTEFDRSIPVTSRLSNNAKRFAFTNGNRLFIADRNSETVIADFEVVDRIADMKFSQDQDLILLLGNTTVDVWNWRRGNRSKRFYLPNSAALEAFDVSQNDQFVAVVTKSRQPKIAIFQLTSETADTPN